MKISKIFPVIACTAIMTLSSCIKEEWGVIPQYQEENSSSTEWNKNKTVDIYYVTNLKGEKCSDINAVSDFFNQKGDAASVGIVERTDVEYYTYHAWGWTQNHSTELAVGTARFTAFVLNKYTDMNIEGNSILFNHKVNSEQTFTLADNCHVKFIPVMTHSGTETKVNIELPLANVTISDQAQLAKAPEVFGKLAGNTYQAVIVGTVKSDLVEALKTVAGNVSGYTFTQATLDAANDYQIFILAPKSWVLRETMKTNVSGNDNAYCLSVEASVE